MKAAYYIYVYNPILHDIFFINVIFCLITTDILSRRPYLILRKF